MASKTTFTQSMVPAWYTNYAQQQLSNQAALSSKPYTPYEGSRLAGFNADQTAGFDATRNAAFSYQPALQQAQQGVGAAMGRSSVSAAAPFVSSVLDSSGQKPAYDMLGDAAKYTEMGANPLGIQMAQPYLDRASGSAVDNISSYMNPYMDKVIQGFADAGARNLQEKLIPAVTNKYITAGQLGGGIRGGEGTPSGMRTDTARALRDVQDSVNKQTADMMMQGWNTALGASQADMSRYGQLAQTAGGLGTAAAEGYSRAGSNLANIGGQYSTMDLNNRKMISDVMSTITQAYGADTANMLAGSGQLAQIAQQIQSQGLAGASAITGIGDKAQALEQANKDIAYQNWKDQGADAQNKLDAMTRTLGAVAPAIGQGSVSYESSKGPSASTLQTLAGLAAQVGGAALASK